MPRLTLGLSAVALAAVPCALAGAAGPPAEVAPSPPVICWQSVDPAILPGFDPRGGAFAGLGSWVATVDGQEFLQLTSVAIPAATPLRRGIDRRLRKLEVQSATPRVFLFAPAPVELGAGRKLDQGRALWVTARDAGVGVRGLVVRVDKGAGRGGRTGTLEIEATDLEGRVTRVLLPSRERVTEPSPGRFCSLPPEVVVPDVVDLELDRARALLEASELLLEISGEAPDSRHGAMFRISDQTPAAGERALHGSVVRSAVGGFSRVPALIGRDVEDARRELSELGLELREVGPGPAFSKEAAFAERVVHRVRSQDPRADAELGVGGAVLAELTAFLPVPDLGGMELGRAARALQARGLLLESDAAAAVRPGELFRVRGQSPATGGLAAEGSPVRVEVVRLVRVPRLAGLTPTAARETLALRGLELTGDEALAESSDDALVVLLEQAPPSRTEVAPGSSVAAEFEVPVPEIRGLTFAAARELLVASGLRLGETRWHRGSSFGIMVVGQGQPAGARVPLGAAVDIALPEPYELPDVSWPWRWAALVAALAAGLGIRRLRRPKAKMEVKADADLAGLEQSARSEDEDTSRIQLDVLLRPVFDAGVQTLVIDTKE